MTTVVGTPCFISCAHADDDQLGGVVDRFRRDLAAYYSAITGKSLNIFRDREGIGWGENWRERIRASVQGATAFIPMVTMRYFDSGPCCEELLAFYNNARQLGVTELLLPVVVLGGNAISASDPREEVRLVEALQYELITDAWMAGFDSPGWRSLMIELVNRLDSALSTAEESLAARALAESSPNARDDREDGSEADLLSMMAAAEEVTPMLSEAMAAVDRFGSTANELFSEHTKGLSAGRMNARILAGASRLTPMAKEVEAKGTAVSSRIAEMDADLRGAVVELRDIDHEFSAQLLGSLLGSNLRLDNVEDTFANIDQVLVALRSVSVLSSALRKAIRPAADGIQALRTAVATFASWADL